jgi:hypothetical protein
MRSPLALLKVHQGDEWGWRVAHSSAVLRGMKAVKVVLIRHPTPEEREMVLATLPKGAEPYHLESLLMMQDLASLEDEGIL